MDRSRFDDLTKALATGASRRSVLKGVLGGVAAGAGVTLVPNIAGAQDDVCIEPLGEMGECEMVEGATPCCGSYTCFESICDNAKGCWEVEDECDTAFPCCDESLVCVDGTCVVGETDAGGEETVDELPATGAGSSTDSNSWAGAVAAGGAAVAAALLLRKGKAQADDAAS